MKDSQDPEGSRLPVKIDSTSNGEFEPQAISKANQAGNKLADDWAGDNAKRLGTVYAFGEMLPRDRPA